MECFSICTSRKVNLKKIKVIYMAVLLCLFSCNEKNNNQAIEVQSYITNVESIELKKKNISKLQRIKNSQTSIKLIELTNNFEKTIFDLTAKLVDSSGGYKYYKDEGYWTNELVNPDDIKTSRKIINEEGYDKIIQELILEHKRNIQEILESSKFIEIEMSNKKLKKEYQSLESLSNELNGLNVSQTMLELSKINRTEKNLIEYIVNKIVENKIEE